MDCVLYCHDGVAVQPHHISPEAKRGEWILPRLLALMTDQHGGSVAECQVNAKQLVKMHYALQLQSHHPNFKDLEGLWNMPVIKNGGLS